VHAKPGYLAFQLVPVGGELGFPGEPALKLGQLVTDRIEGVERVDQLADGGCGEHRNAVDIPCA
jgi:hypothetical protein